MAGSLEAYLTPTPTSPDASSFTRNSLPDPDERDVLSAPFPSIESALAAAQGPRTGQEAKVKASSSDSTTPSAMLAQPFSAISLSKAPPTSSQPHSTIPTNTSFDSPPKTTQKLPKDPFLLSPGPIYTPGKLSLGLGLGSSASPGGGGSALLNDSIGDVWTTQGGARIDSFSPGPVKAGDDSSPGGFFRSRSNPLGGTADAPPSFDASGVVPRTPRRSTGAATLNASPAVVDFGGIRPGGPAVTRYLTVTMSSSTLALQTVAAGWIGLPPAPDEFALRWTSDAAAVKAPPAGSRSPSGATGSVLTMLSPLEPGKLEIILNSPASASSSEPRLLNATLCLWVLSSSSATSSPQPTSSSSVLQVKLIGHVLPLEGTSPTSRPSTKAPSSSQALQWGVVSPGQDHPVPCDLATLWELGHGPSLAPGTMVDLDMVSVMDPLASASGVPVSDLPPAFTMSSRSFSADHSGRVSGSLLLTFSSSRPGIHRARFSMTPRGSSGVAGPSVTLTAEATVAEASWNVSPAQALDFGPVPYNAPSRQVLTLANNGDVRVTLRARLLCAIRAQRHSWELVVDGGGSSRRRTSTSRNDDSSRVAEITLEPGATRVLAVFFQATGYKIEDGLVEYPAALVVSQTDPPEGGTSLDDSIGDLGSNTSRHLRLDAQVGYGRLQVPRSAQTWEFDSSDSGSKSSHERWLPIRNAGVIPMDVSLAFETSHSSNAKTSTGAGNPPLSPGLGLAPGAPSWFTVEPSQVSLAPGSESRVLVRFKPPASSHASLLARALEGATEALHVAARLVLSAGPTTYRLDFTGVLRPEQMIALGMGSATSPPRTQSDPRRHEFSSAGNDGDLHVSFATPIRMGAPAKSPPTSTTHQSPFSRRSATPDRRSSSGVRRRLIPAPVESASSSGHAPPLVERGSAAQSADLVTDRPVLSWGGVGVGRSSVASVTLRNPSESEALSVNVSVASVKKGSDAGGPCFWPLSSSIVIAPQSQQSLPIRFAPLDVLSYRAELVMTAGPFGGTYKLPLVGYGGVSSVVLQPREAGRLGDGTGLVDCGEGRGPERYAMYLGLRDGVEVGSTRVCSSFVLVNRGARTGFAAVTCEPQPEGWGVYVVPAAVTIPAGGHQVFEVSIARRPGSGAAGGEGPVFPKNLRLVVYGGDELARQRRRMVKLKEGPGGVGGPQDIFDGVFVGEELEAGELAAEERIPYEDYFDLPLFDGGVHTMEIALHPGIAPVTMNLDPIQPSTGKKWIAPARSYDQQQTESESVVKSKAPGKSRRKSRHPRGLFVSGGAEWLAPPTSVSVETSGKIKVCNGATEGVEVTVTGVEPPFFVRHRKFEIQGHSYVMLPIRFQPGLEGIHRGGLTLSGSVQGVLNTVSVSLEGSCGGSE